MKNCFIVVIIIPWPTFVDCLSLYCLECYDCVSIIWSFFCQFHVSAQPLPPAVLALQPPQFGTHYPLASVVLPLQTLSVASSKVTASSRPTATGSGSAKCLRFGHWLTLCTLNMHVLTYLLTYLEYTLYTVFRKKHSRFLFYLRRECSDFHKIFR